MAKYPAWVVGQRVTADLLSAMQADVVVKTTSTVRASNTTLSADPELVVSVDANATYLIEFHVWYATTTAASFKTSWTVPAGVTTSNRDMLGLGPDTAVDATPSSTAFATRAGVHGYATTLPYGSRNSVSLQLQAIETAIVNTGATAGTISFNWAQFVLTAVNTTVAAGSWARATRLA